MISAAAELLRHLYEKYRQKEYPRYRVPDRYFNSPVWEKAEAMRKEFELDPEIFIQIIFREWGDDCPQPNHMAGKVVRDIIENRVRMTRELALVEGAQKDLEPEDLMDMSQMTVRYIKRRVEEAGVTLRAHGAETVDSPQAIKILRSPIYGIQPYVRVMLAPQDDIVIERYMEDTMWFYENDKIFRRTMDKIGVGNPQEYVRRERTAKYS